MTAWHSGRVIQLADQGLAGLDGVAVLVLATMWSFARRDPPHYCTASVPRIARRAHLSPRAVGYALHRLKAAGWVDWKDDPKPGVTIERILTPLPTPARDAGVDDAGTPARDAQTPARDAGTPARDAANSQESSRLKGSDDDSDQDGRDGADAPRSALEGDVMERLGVGRAEARAQIDAWLAAAKRPPRNVAAYLRTCLRNAIADQDRRADDGGDDEMIFGDYLARGEPCRGPCNIEPATGRLWPEVKPKDQLLVEWIDADIPDLQRAWMCDQCFRWPATRLALAGKPRRWLNIDTGQEVDETKGKRP